METENLTLRQKILQMFIAGYTGEYSSNKYLMEFLKDGLGGIIFFSYNIKSAAQFKKLIKDINSKSLIPLFFSIDQEGGRVERTEAIHNGKKYLSAKFAYEKGIDFLKTQTAEMAVELNDYGINMNFAPVLDVNTNEKNPIIGERAYSSITSEVIEATSIVIDGYRKFNIIPVGKHFPGHGDASSDSHKTLPVIDLAYQELEEKHIKPFEEAIKMGLPAIMAAHVFYPAIEENNTPASISEKIIKNLLIEKLGFNGVIITDDMEMNGIKGFPKLEAAIKAINAGVCMFIFRDTTKEVYELVNGIENAVKQGSIKEEDINLAVNKISELKRQYGII